MMDGRIQRQIIASLSLTVGTVSSSHNNISALDKVRIQCQGSPPKPGRCLLSDPIATMASVG